MSYGKIENDNIIFANVGSKNLRIGNKVIWGRATANVLLQNGFIELIPTENTFEEREGYYYYYTWEIIDDVMVCVWREEIINEDII